MYIEIAKGEKIFVATREIETVYTIEFSDDPPRIILVADDADDDDRSGVVYQKTIIDKSARKKECSIST